MSTGIIVLAAGSSSRLGHPKQLVTWAGTTLVRHAAETALASALGPLLVMVGAEADATREQLAGLDAAAVMNPDWREGMGSSIRAGLRRLGRDHPAAAGCLVMTCDQPAVTAQHLRTLVAGGASSGAGIGASWYGATAGVPAYFDRRHFAALLSLAGDQGARGLIAGHLESAFLAPLPGGELDIDRTEDLPP